jgi:hypothetical protein
MNRNVLMTVLSVSILFLSSCKKDDDEDPATAKVQYSEWFTANPWKKDTIFSVFGFNYYKDAPAITKDIMDKGTVLVYGKLLGYNALAWPSNQIAQLPISLTYQQGTIMTDTWAASDTVGKVKIRFTNDQNYYSSIAATHQFRYIVISGGIPAGRGISLSYKDICKLYNIPE